MTFDAQAMLADDWRFAEGVVDATFDYGPDRNRTGLAAAPATGVKVRPGNPTLDQIALAQVGYETTDRLFTIWSDTLRTDPADPLTERLYPDSGDRLTVGGLLYIIQYVKQTMYDTQYIAYAKLSTKARRNAELGNG